MPFERVTRSKDGDTWVDTEPDEVAYGYAMQNAMIQSNFRKENYLDITVYPQGDRNPKNNPSAKGIYPRVRVLASDSVVIIDGSPYKFSGVSQEITFTFDDQWDTYHYFYIYPTEAGYEVRSIWERDYTFRNGLREKIKWQSKNGYEGYVLTLGNKDYTMLHQFLYVNKFGKGTICKFPERNQIDIWCPHHTYGLGNVVRYKESIMVSRKDQNKSTPPADWDYLVIDIEDKPHFQPTYWLPPVGTMVTICNSYGG